VPFTTEPRSWGPSALDDVHMGGAVMWIGGAAIMFVVIMVTFFEWTRETRPTGGMGWLESARRATLAERIGPGAANANVNTAAIAEATARTAREPGNVDEDDEQLAAYNAYLARLNGPGGHDAAANS